MLTKDDLLQIKRIVDTSVDNSLDTKLQPAMNQILEAQLRPMKKDISKIKEDLSTLILSSNREDMRTLKRVKIIEEHVGL